MKTRLLKTTVLNLTLTLTLGSLSLSLLTNCSPAEFRFYSEEKQAANGAQGTPVVCDPFDSSNIVPAKSGLRGSIHYLTASQPHYQSSTDIIKFGTKVNAELYMNQVHVPEREFDAGFVSDGGGITDDSGRLLTEWFALNLESKLKLAPGETPGDYQIALLSDDGSSLYFADPSKRDDVFINHEGDHSTTLGCASQVITMTEKSVIPFNLRYYQGPRNRIALSILWRKIPAGGSLREVECGRGGNDYFYNHGTATTAATPRAPFNGLLARGWKPLSNSNFELQSGSNLCAK